jgi:hypothetical protein
LGRGGNGRPRRSRRVDAFDVTGPCLLDRAADVSAQTRQLDHVPGELLDRGGVAGWPARPPETTLWQGAENGMAGRHDPWHTSRAGASLPLSTTTGGARRRGRRSGRMEGGAELRRLSTRRAVRSSRTVQSRREPARRTHAKTWGPPRATRCESRATAPLVDHWPSKRRARSSADLAAAVGCRLSLAGSAAVGLCRAVPGDGGRYRDNARNG